MGPEKNVTRLTDSFNDLCDKEKVKAKEEDGPEDLNKRLISELEHAMRFRSRYVMEEQGRRVTEIASDDLKKVLEILKKKNGPLE